MEKILRVKVDTDVARIQLGVAGWDYVKLKHMTDDAIFHMAVGMADCYGVRTSLAETTCSQLPIAGESIYRCDNPNCHRKVPNGTDMDSVKFCSYCGAEFKKISRF